MIKDLKTNGEKIPCNYMYWREKLKFYIYCLFRTEVFPVEAKFMTTTISTTS